MTVGFRVIVEGGLGTWMMLTWFPLILVSIVVYGLQERSFARRVDLADASQHGDLLAQRHALVRRDDETVITFRSHAIRYLFLCLLLASGAVQLWPDSPVHAGVVAAASVCTAVLFLTWRITVTLSRVGAELRAEGAGYVLGIRFWRRRLQATTLTFHVRELYHDDTGTPEFVAISPDGAKAILPGGLVPGWKPSPNASTLRCCASVLNAYAQERAPV
ncbi:MAG: hypothetical protein PVJ57_19540 [Phycisphaerae bacterium]|jgi:hypothetical protein